jgi:hypothetical protein
MTRRAQENIVAGLLLCIFAGYIIMCLGFGPNARLVPLPMAIFGFVLVAVQIIRQNLGSTDTAQDSRRELWAFGGVVIFVCLIALLGPIAAVFLFASGYLFLSRHAGIGKAVAVAGVFTITLYLLFVVGLQLQLYHGILRPLIDP